MCTVLFPTVVLVMLCTKSTQVKMLRRIDHNAGKIHLLLNVTVNFIDSQVSLCYWLSKHVPGMFSVKDTVFSISCFNPSSEISRVLYEQRTTGVNIVKIKFLKIKYKQLPFQVVFSLQCTKRAVFFLKS